MVGVASMNEAPDIEVVEPFAALEAAMHSAKEIASDQLDEIAMTGWEILDFSQSGATAPPLQSQHVRFRGRFLVLSCDATGAILVLLVGTRRFSFVCAIGVVVIPFPIVIERGTDITVSITGGGVGFSYLIGKPE